MQGSILHKTGSDSKDIAKNLKTTRTRRKLVKKHWQLYIFVLIPLAFFRILTYVNSLCTVKE